MRSGAAKALGELKDVRAVALLINSLKDGNWHVHNASAAALGQLGDASAVAPLIDAFKNRGNISYDSVARALEQIGEAAINPLITALDDKNEYVRHEAAWTLAKLDHFEGGATLITAFKSLPGWQADKERYAAALEKWGTPEAMEAVRKWRKENKK